MPAAARRGGRGRRCGHAAGRRANPHSESSASRAVDWLEQQPGVDMDDFLTRSAGMDLNGHLDRIRVPFLVTHGAKDRQIGLDYAHQTCGQLVNSPRREPKIFTEREGGVEHVGADDMSFGRDYIADWFAETLGGLTT